MTATRTINVTDLVFHTLPADQGQIVETSYAETSFAVDPVWMPEPVWALVQKTYDRSDGETSYYVATICDEDEDAFQPWNGQLPSHGEWEEVLDEDSDLGRMIDGVS